jgi:hypothetical protein
MELFARQKAPGWDAWGERDMKINYSLLAVCILMIVSSMQFLMQGNKPAAGMMFFVGLGNGCGAFLQ